MSSRSCFAKTFSIVVLGVALSACAMKPTKSKENPERRRDGSSAPKVLAETVILDARPAFDYTTAHVPRSVQVQWSDFTEPEPPQRGILQGDLYGVARRLARLGVGPDSQVVVVGRGHEGEGEEGRIAWMLTYLGVGDVQFSSLDAMKFRLTNAVEENPLKSVAIWKPEPLESLNVTRDEVLFAINKRAVHEPASYKGQTATLYRLIDVRTVSGYLGREGIGAQKTVPNMDAVNIPWREFFHPNMRYKQEIASRLRDVGVMPEHRIIVLGEDGVSSAAVTMAMRSLGFSNTGNYAGGLRDLMSSAQ